jgi:Fic family protein
MRYNWQQPDWPEFRYNLAQVQQTLLSFAEKSGYVSGLLKGLPERARIETVTNLMVSEAINNSAIEGEYFSRADVMSSIRNNLGLSAQVEQVRDKRAGGVADLMVDLRQTYQESLTEEQLFAWHNMLFIEPLKNVTSGTWRTHKEPMQIISGVVGKIKVHFEAPPSDRVAEEMSRFISWFNDSSNDTTIPTLVHAALAHLYFESIHPFEDGNGRIGRAIAEKALSQGLGYPVLLSLSQTIEANKKGYYDALKSAQKSNQVSDWIGWFTQAVLDAQDDAEKLIVFTLKKSQLFDRLKGQLNERQLKVIQRMLAEGPDGFTGGMNAKKYIALTGTSKATATRDLQSLADKEVLRRSGGGRSTRYCLVI